MAWNEQQIKHLENTGKIRGFKVTHIKRPQGPIPKSNRDSQGWKSKGLEWLDLNLQYFANENALSLEKELQFDPERKWRFDYAFPAIKTAVEFEGGIFIPNSGHKTAKHFTKDTSKYTRAAIIGWKVLRYTALNYKKALSDLKEILNETRNMGSASI